MKTIHYIGLYLAGDNHLNLRVFPSAVTKMNYILSVLFRANFNVKLFSPTETKNKFLCHYPSKRIFINKQFEIIYSDTIGGPFLIFKVISRFWSLLQLAFYLVFKVKKNEYVLVYHIYTFRWIIKIVRFIRSNLKIFFEVEEIYNAAWNKEFNKITKEVNYLKNAQGYIFVNDLMNEKFNFKKPFVVCYGNYSLKKNENQLLTKGSEIRIVYAGIIEGENSDVFLALKTMFFLPLNYSLHILGYGQEENIKLLKNKISEINKQKGKGVVQYHGLLNGSEYTSFLQKCHIGLSTRVLDNEMSNYTFPSKILVYLTNGLIPISSNISCVKKSKLSDFIIFYDNSTPKCVAKAILKVDYIKKSPNSVLKNLDESLVSQMISLFS